MATSLFISQSIKKMNKQQTPLYRRFAKINRGFLNEENPKMYPKRKNNKGQQPSSQLRGDPLKCLINFLTKQNATRYNIGTLLNGSLQNLKALIKDLKGLNVNQMFVAQIYKMDKYQLKQKQATIRAQFIKKYHNLQNQQKKGFAQELDELFITDQLQFDPEGKLRKNKDSRSLEQQRSENESSNYCVRSENQQRNQSEETQTSERANQNQSKNQMQPQLSMDEADNQFSQHYLNPQSQQNNWEDMGLGYSLDQVSSLQAFIDQRLIDMRFIEKIPDLNLVLDCESQFD